MHVVGRHVEIFDLADTDPRAAHEDHVIDVELLIAGGVPDDGRSVAVAKDDVVGAAAFGTGACPPAQWAGCPRS